MLCVWGVEGGGGGGVGLQTSKNKTFSIFIIIIVMMFEYISCLNSTQIYLKMSSDAHIT